MKRILNIKRTQNQSLGFLYNDITKQILNKVDGKNLLALRNVNSVLCLLATPSCVMMELLRKTTRLFPYNRYPYRNPDGTAIMIHDEPFPGWLRMTETINMQPTDNTPKTYTIITSSHNSTLIVDNRKYLLPKSTYDFINGRDFCVKVGDDTVFLYLEDYVFYLTPVYS